MTVKRSRLLFDFILHLIFYTKMNKTVGEVIAILKFKIEMYKIKNKGVIFTQYVLCIIIFKSLL